MSLSVLTVAPQQLESQIDLESCCNAGEPTNSGVGRLLNSVRLGPEHDCLWSWSQEDCQEFICKVHRGLGQIFK